MNVFNLIFLCFIFLGITLTGVVLRQRKANRYLKDLSGATKVITENEYSELGIAIQSNEKMMKCPSCAEYVKLEASICKHCQRDISKLTSEKRDSVEKFSETKRLAREQRDLANRKTLALVASVALVVTFSIVLLSATVNFISTKRIEQKKNTRLVSIENEFQTWKAAQKKCGLTYAIEKNLQDSDNPIAALEVGSFIGRDQIVNYWSSPIGIQVDCFAKEVLGIEISRYFNVTNENPENFEHRYLYDENFTDSKVEGLAADKNGFYQGELYATSLSIQDHDFLFSITWNPPSNS